MRIVATAAAALALALAGCQAPDVGSHCDFSLPLPATLAGDYLESGNTQCDNLVCIASSAPLAGKAKNNPYCSKPCVGDADCSPSDTGLVCRAVVLDDAFLATLTDQQKATYLGGASSGAGSFSKYCAVPLQ